MATETVQMYRALCDRCGKCAQDDGDYFAWADDEQAINEATESDWNLFEDGGLYCIECVEWNEAEDALVPKSVLRSSPDNDNGRNNG